MPAVALPAEATSSVTPEEADCIIRMIPTKACGHKLGIWCACIKLRQPINIDDHYKAEQDADSYRDMG